MEYDFNSIESKWQQKWKADKAYKVSNESTKPKYYVLDMFPYPSGAGLHVGHPLGYIASDIYSRYKRLKGFNVLHPMGFDSFGLPAEQYALETGQHPAVTTEKNIETFKAQLDKIGFCYDWDREVRTSDASYYKWTQKIFLELFNSYFCNTCKQAKPITELIKKYEERGGSTFTAVEWAAFTKAEQAEILMKRRLAFSKYGEVNWCEALGTVLANDEVVNGVSERGGHPVEKKKMRQWYLRITAYADRLLQGLETVQFSEPMKEMQRNWIGRSEGAEILFLVPSTQAEKGDVENEAKIVAIGAALAPKYSVSSPMHYELARQNRKNHTEAEDTLWQELRANKLDAKFRRQHAIDAFIVDFVSLQDALILEADGGYHENEEQKLYDENRTRILTEIGFTVIRFTNDEILSNIETVKNQIKLKLKELSVSKETQTHREESRKIDLGHPSPQSGEGKGVRCYTTRPDTIFGVDFLVLAPEHALVAQITTDAEKEKIEAYLTYVKSRSDRERQAEVKQITGCFTGTYATNPFNGKAIPIWIAEYVLAGYGTGAIMAVPCGDQRDFAFAKHFNIPITNIIGNDFNGNEANATKDATLQNSDFLNGMLMKDAIAIAINKIEELGIGKRKVNFRMRDAGFSRQRYWGEPFPIVWQDGIAIPLTENELPLELPYAEKYGPGPNGEGPLGNMEDWLNLTPIPKESGEENLTPNPSPQERELEDFSEEESEVLQLRGYMNSTYQEWKNTFEFAKRNRKNLTDAEDKVWQLVRNRNIDNFKFRRQHPIAGFIPDFVCLETKLIVEIDGGYHNKEEQIIFDEARENWLKELGFDIIRFTNEQVLKDITLIKKIISEKLKTLSDNASLQSSQAPLPWRGGGEVSSAPFPQRGGGEVSLRRETSTMPGYAGSSWYFLRYMDPKNAETFCDRKASDYWNQVDVYVGGTEHAVGHLLYSRMWTKVLYDLGYIGFEEPFKKLVNQGMIQGSSRFVYRVNVRGIETLFSKFLDNYFFDQQFKKEVLFENFRFDFGNTESKIFIELKNQKDISKTLEKFEKFPDDFKILLISNEEFIDKYVSGNAIELKKWFDLILGNPNNRYISPNSKTTDLIVSTDLIYSKDELEATPIDYLKSLTTTEINKLPVNVNFVDGFKLNIKEFTEWKNGIFKNAIILPNSDDDYICDSEVEKMSKSKYNTVNPDELCNKYGADTFRMYEMFLGPVEQSKPWDTKGIEGVHRFLKKLWRLFYADISAAPSPLERGGGEVKWHEAKPEAAHYKILHKTIKKIEQDTENFSYNTAVAAFMIAVNELTDAKCSHKEILSQVLILLSPYAPHIAEELWANIGMEGSILDATYPVLDESYLVEATKEYPVSINGKMRGSITLATEVTEDEAKNAALASENITKWMEGKDVKKFIFVKGRMINIVI